MPTGAILPVIMHWTEVLCAMSKVNCVEINFANLQWSALLWTISHVSSVACSAGSVHVHVPHMLGMVVALWGQWTANCQLLSFPELWIGHITPSYPCLVTSSCCWIAPNTRGCRLIVGINKVQKISGRPVGFVKGFRPSLNCAQDAIRKDNAF